MKKIILTCLLFLFFVNGYSQAISSYFFVAPDDVLMQLEANRRKDLVDLAKLNRQATVTNRLGGTSELKVLTDDFLHLQLTERNSLQMRLLPLNDSVKIMGLIKTICGPSCDSQVRFFTTTWGRLESSQIFVAPSIDSFVKPGTDTSDPEVIKNLSKIDMKLVSCEFNKDSNELQAFLNIKENIPEDIYKTISPYLIDGPLIYKWNNGKYEVQKN